MSNDLNKFKQLNHIPVVLVGRDMLDITYQEDFNLQMCRRLNLESGGCVAGITITVVVSWMFYVVLFVLLIWLGVFIVAFFRNRLRREMNKELKMQVSTAVEHYFELSDSK